MAPLFSGLGLRVVADPAPSGMRASAPDAGQKPGRWVSGALKPVPGVDVRAVLFGYTRLLDATRSASRRLVPVWVAEVRMSGGEARSAGDDAGRPCYVYMVRCADGSLYTGVTSDVRRRLAEHLGRTSRAARYTRSHRVEALAMLWKTPSRRVALSLEWRIHHSTRAQKERLVRHPSTAAALVDGRCHTVPSNWRRAYWEAARAL